MKTETTHTHTQGPWKAHPAFFFGHDSFQITGTNGDSSPFLCRLTDDTPNFEANARLIAACPDLLAALKSLVFEASHFVHGNGKNGTFVANELKNAIAAISKAEGNV